MSHYKGLSQESSSAYAQGDIIPPQANKEAESPEVAREKMTAAVEGCNHGIT